MAEQDGDVEALRSECTNLKCELQEALVSKEAYTTKLKAKTKEVKEVEGRVRTAEERIKELEAALKLETGKVAKLEANIHSLVAEKTELGGEAQSGRDDLRERLEQQEEKVLNLQDQVDELQGTLAQRDQRIQELSDVVAGLGGEAPPPEPSPAPPSEAAPAVHADPHEEHGHDGDAEYARDSSLLKEALEQLQGEVEERDEEVATLRQKLQKKMEDNLQLREVIANMQTRDAAGQLDPNADGAEAKRDSVIEELKAENHRLVTVIMELKKFEAEMYNADIVRDSWEKHDDKAAASSKPSKQKPKSSDKGGNAKQTADWQVVDPPNDPYDGAAATGDDPLKEAKESVHQSLHKKIKYRDKKKALKDTLAGVFGKLAS
eukprot:TRINITY_DN2899_c0_g1_i3.p1 TRINITY_DN2899_c0_g1~~TRINITY_DN2899_c0_g1_i3.p1  ORF type:complete len:377 (+),score=175.05 TRINITY_DN2899_c0_g1_i3:71-1201(+)